MPQLLVKPSYLPYLRPDYEERLTKAKETLVVNKFHPHPYRRRLASQKYLEILEQSDFFRKIEESHDE